MGGALGPATVAACNKQHMRTWPAGGTTVAATGLPSHTPWGGHTSGSPPVASLNKLHMITWLAKSGLSAVTRVAALNKALTLNTKIVMTVTTAFPTEEGLTWKRLFPVGNTLS